MTQRTHIVGLSLSVVALIFGAMWAFGSVMLSALPGVNPEGVVRQFGIAVSVTIVSGLLATFFGMLLVRAKRTRDRTMKNNRERIETVDTSGGT